MSSSAYLFDDVLAKILLRLPPQCVLRSRAVSRRWRSITTCPAFVDAYSRRRPLELLVYPDGLRTGSGARNALASFDPAGGTIGRLLRFGDPLRLVDSCDGLLLFARHQRRFQVCNPATRRWADLPSLTPRPCANVLASGFYFHRPSGEHRLLCIGDHPPPSHEHHAGSDAAVAAYARSFYYILSTGGGGAAEPRRLGPVAGGGGDPFPSACVAIRGTLYWSRHPEAGGGGDVVAFDTVSEAFRRISPPPLAGPHRRTFEMDGRLAVSAAETSSQRMDVWALQDGGGGGGEKWACLLRVDLPAPRFCAGWLPSYDSYEAVAVLEGGLLVVAGAGWVVLYDVKGKRTVSRADLSGSVGNMSRCLFRESLVLLPGADTRPCRRAVPGGWTSSCGGKSSGTWIVSNDQ